MNFKEFDMSEYYNVLEEFKTEQEDKVIKSWGSVDKYNEFIEKCKSKEDEIAKMAIKKYQMQLKKVKNFTKWMRERIIGVIQQNFIYQIPHG